MKQHIFKHILLVAFCACLATTLFAVPRPAHNTFARCGLDDVTYPGRGILNGYRAMLAYTCQSHMPIKVIYQPDGNLVLYVDNVPKWSTHTAGATFGCAIFQADGNLVVYAKNSRGRNVPVWSSHTSGQGATRMSLQSDGNLVIYRGPTPLWATHTGGFA